MPSAQRPTGVRGRLIDASPCYRCHCNLLESEVSGNRGRPEFAIDWISQPLVIWVRALRVCGALYRAAAIGTAGFVVNEYKTAIVTGSWLSAPEGRAACDASSLTNRVRNTAICTIDAA